MVLIIVITMLGNNINLERKVSSVNTIEKEAQDVEKGENNKQETSLDSSKNTDSSYDSIKNVEQNVYENENKTDISTTKNIFENPKIFILIISIIGIILLIIVCEIIKNINKIKYK